MDTAGAIEMLSDPRTGLGSGRELSTISAVLGNMGENGLIEVFFMCYRSRRRAAQRHACVYWASSYARTTERAYQLGLEALLDRSKGVRERACQLLAFSLRKEALPFLEKRRSEEKDASVLSCIEAAIDAIQCQNHHFFLDREHTGRVFMEFMCLDD